MSKDRALNNFGGMSNLQLVNKALTVHTDLTGNADFPNPDPTLDALNTATQQFSDAIVQAESKDKVKVEMRKALRLVLIDILRKITAYCNYTADGDRTKLAGTGLDISAPKATKIELGKIENFTVVQGKNSGEADLKWKRPRGVKSCIIQYGPVPITNDNWKLAYPAFSHHTLTGLVRGTEYAMRIIASGSGGQVIVSITINFIAM